MPTPLDQTGLTGGSPPSNPTFTQTVFPIAQVANQPAVQYPLGLLAPGDILSEIILTLQTVGAGGSTNYPQNVSISLVNELGQVLIPTTFITGNVQSTSPTMAVSTFIEVLPMLYRAATNGRQLTLIVTNQSQIQGKVTLGVRRNFRPFDTWRT